MDKTERASGFQQGFCIRAFHGSRHYLPVRVRGFSNSSAPTRVGSGGVRNLMGRSGGVGSGRVGSGRIGSGQEVFKPHKSDRSGPTGGDRTSEKPWFSRPEACRGRGEAKTFPRLCVFIPRPKTRIWRGNESATQRTMPYGLGTCYVLHVLHASAWDASSVNQKCFRQNKILHPHRMR